jgi:hypothetical protein
VTRHIVSVINKMQKANIKSLQPRLEVCEQFKEHADLFLKRTAWSGHCRSWFKQGRLDGTPTVFPGSRLVYMELLEEPRYEDYEIAYWQSNAFAFLGNGFSAKEFDGSDLAYYLGTETAPGGMLKPKKSEVIGVGPKDVLRVQCVETVNNDLQTA